MQQAIEVAATARLRTSPNPWVGCVLVTTDGRTFTGATEPPGGRHAERVALDAAAAAGADAIGATAYVTLEPCSHHGRTPPCADALVQAGVARVVLALTDPDPKVAGRGIERLRAAGIEVRTGVHETAAAVQLAPYLHHRRTGRPFVVLKLATTLDGRIAAADGTSQWITGVEARTAAHRLRAESDAILVGAGTVRTDDPTLTTRLVEGPSPRRVVLGRAPQDAKVHPCLEWQGELPDLLDRLGSEGVLQAMVEGGARVAGAFHTAGLVDRYVLHLAPALMGDGDGALHGVTTSTISDLWRGRIVSLRQLGDDIEVVLEPLR
ncbi:MAG: bifunctional diaminohydroxyphosphoribosylaminopyrimidine deaminase/5-amino-6-(5-phosphoribosylamino)uracil reductase RibD [Acidobacteria bacterium]|nr:bifunctional diaminohydroxyphosphoribosylaminopyrimidine deaminase/5-amino-6-(5-phosphoribosylamino)uracil reductase RibD [Acidobacteriota bacterium]